jgi:hypothetical protein
MIVSVRAARSGGILSQQILKSQFPRTFTRKSHYVEDFSEFVLGVRLRKHRAFVVGGCSCPE